MTAEELASYIDYSVLKPEFTEEEIINLTKDGVSLGCATICINPAYLELCEPYVKGSKTTLCPVTDFPFGDSMTVSRAAQIETSAKYDCVKEIDIVSNFGKIRSGKDEEVLEDLKVCADTAHKYGKELKVILETDALTKEEIVRGAKIVLASGADYVKTSTGFLTGHESKGAAVEVIQLLMDTVGDKIKIKGSGCIRTREHFLKLINMGIDRMGVGYKSVPVVLNLNR